MRPRDMQNLERGINAAGDCIANFLVRLAFAIIGIAACVGLFFGMRPVTEWLVRLWRSL